MTFNVFWERSDWNKLINANLYICFILLQFPGKKIFTLFFFIPRHAPSFLEEYKPVNFAIMLQKCISHLKRTIFSPGNDAYDLK